MKLYIYSIVSLALASSAFADAKIPIVGWAALPQDMATKESYSEAKDAGFTHLTQWCKTPADAENLLSKAEKAGIKLIIGLETRRIEDVKQMSDMAEQFTAAVKNSPALEFYYVGDEPSIAKAEVISECVKRYDMLDPSHPCYVNLVGASWDPIGRRDERKQKVLTGFATYDEFLRRLYEIVPLKMVSFDVYPVCASKYLGNSDHRLHGVPAILHERWYETLETASAFARERGIPMYAFALSTAHTHFPGNEYAAPTIRHLRLQMYSNLAYGAQMLQYYRYYMGGIAPIIKGGKRSPVFEIVREMNQELQARAHVFLGSKVQNVWHTGVKIPIGTKSLDTKALPSFVRSFSADKGAELFLSWLKNGGKDYLVVGNRDPNDETTFKATFAPSSVVVRRDGTSVKADAYADFFWLEPGDVAIFSAP